jgi:hypothetical protein
MTLKETIRGTILATGLFSASCASAATYQLGNDWFGATLQGDTTQSLTNTTYTLNAQGRADGKVFKKDIPLAEGQLSLLVQKTNDNYVKGFLKAGGKTLVSLDHRFRNTVDFSTPKHTVVQVGGRAGFDFGPVSVSASGQATVQVYAIGSLNCAWHPNHPPVVTARCGPGADISGQGAARADLWVIGGGIDGSINLSGYAIMGNLTLTPRTGGGRTQADGVWSVSFDRASTQGSVKVWARVLGFKKTKTLVDINRGAESSRLAGGTFRLN